MFDKKIFGKIKTDFLPTDPILKSEVIGNINFHWKFLLRIIVFGKPFKMIDVMFARYEIWSFYLGYLNVLVSLYS
jgi:hypothetical protein